MSHRILIIGAGRIGGTLGKAWLEHGHDVRFGVPDPKSPKYADFPQERLQPATERRGAEIVVFAVPYAALASAAKALGDLSGAILIDCTNPVGMTPSGFGLIVGPNTSAAEQLASLAPGAHVFKSLNQTGAENLAEPGVYHPKPVMFVAGDDASGKKAVLELVGEVGFDAVDAGGLVAARLLESFALLWSQTAMKRGRARGFTFAMIPHPTKS